MCLPTYSSCCLIGLVQFGPGAQIAIVWKEALCWHGSEQVVQLDTEHRFPVRQLVPTLNLKEKG